MRSGSFVFVALLVCLFVLACAVGVLVVPVLRSGRDRVSHWLWVRSRRREWYSGLSVLMQG